MAGRTPATEINYFNAEKKQTIKEFGDLLKRNNLNLLSQISNYETIWATYIGNNGLAQPIEIKNIDLAKDNKRKLIWQENRASRGNKWESNRQL